MKSVISCINWITSIATLLVIIPYCHSFKEFQCPNRVETMPNFPQAYSTNIRINFETGGYTVEAKHAVNTKEGKEVIELKKADRRVKYISRGDQNCTLVIAYNKNESPKCVVKKNIAVSSFFESVDAGPSEILNKISEVMSQTNKIRLAVLGEVNTIVVKVFEGCFPEVNISYSFTVKWNNSHVSSLNPNANYPVLAEAQVDGDHMSAQFSNFDPTDPDDALFQPPPDVYCKGFRTDKVPPKILNYFSYDAEIIVYESALGIAPLVSRRKVFYDYPAGISRIDFYDPLTKDSDMYAPISASEKSIIHDFHAGVQYSFDPYTGKCTQDNFQSTYSVISSKETVDGGMLNGTEFFYLNNATTSYNGQFPVRGMMADVYTAIIVDPHTNESSLVTWYFSTGEIRMVETSTLEKNVLLRMTIRPVTDEEGEKEGVVEVQIYNFANEQPSVLKYDITSCYNDSNSRIFVMTFPAHSLLRGYEKLIGILIHAVIKDVTGVAKQRLIVKEVIFRGKYMYAEFELLDVPPFSNKNKNPELKISLDDALSKLRKSISTGTFSVKVTLEKQGGEHNVTKTINLRVEPDGLNEFAGDRVITPSVEGYKEGSVIGLTIGMLILGFVLGGVVLNLVMSKKFGVSLFQKSKYGNQPFGDSLGESSM